MGDTRRAIDKLQQWAKRGDQNHFECAPPADDAAERLQAPTPEHGAVPAWQLPPSLVEALALFSSATIKWGPDLGHDEFVVFDPSGMEEWSGIVYLPEGVARGADGPELSTNHLVPFASAGDDECAFCFDVSVAAPGGEYPVYFHHQDHARAKIAETGEWEDPDDATADFPSFAAWLMWVATTLDAGAEPESSYPTAFHNMPGRSANG